MEEDHLYFLAPWEKSEDNKNDNALLQKIANELENEWQMGGLSEGLYFDWAREIAIRFYHAKTRKTQD